MSLSQLLQLRLKLVSSEMPLGGVMEQSPPLGGIAVGVIAVEKSKVLLSVPILTPNRPLTESGEKFMRHTAAQFLAITGTEKF